MKEFIEKVRQLQRNKLLFGIGYGLLIAVGVTAIGAVFRVLISESNLFTPFFRGVIKGFSLGIQYPLGIWIVHISAKEAFEMSVKSIEKFKVIIKTPLFWKIQRFNGVMALMGGVTLLCQSLIIFVGCQLIYTLEVDLYSAVGATKPYDLLMMYVKIMIIVTTLKGAYRTLISSREGKISLTVKELLIPIYNVIVLLIIQSIINYQGQPYSYEGIAVVGIGVIIIKICVQRIKKWLCERFVYQRAPLLDKAKYHLVYTSSASHFLDRFSTLIALEETEELPVEISLLSAEEFTMLDIWQEQTVRFSERYASGTYDIHLIFTYPLLWTELDVVFNVHKHKLEQDLNEWPHWLDWVKQYNHQPTNHYIENHPFSDVLEIAKVSHEIVLGEMCSGKNREETTRPQSHSVQRDDVM